MEKLKVIGYTASIIFSIGFGYVMMREQDRINHRLDVGDAKEWKALVDGNKARDVERSQLKTTLQEIYSHCAKQRDGCNLPYNLTVIPENPEIEPIETTLLKAQENK